MVDYNLINQVGDKEIQDLDELLRELQSETLNEDYGYWHFALLQVKDGEYLAERICSSLAAVEKYKDPYRVNSATGTKTYIAALDIKNLKLEPVGDLKTEIITKAEHWAKYSGAATDKPGITERFHSMKVEVADKIVAFLQSKEIIEVKLVQGIDTYYAFGGDHLGDDILIDTGSGVYLIHFGFSS